MAMKSPHIFYEIATNRLDAQLTQIEAIDRKVATFLGFASAILAVFAAVFRFVELAQGPLYVLILSYTTVAIYIALVIFALRAYGFMRWSYRPHLETLKQHCLTYDEAIMKQWVAAECIRSIKTNEDRIAAKTSAAQKVIRLLVAETTVVSVTVLLLISLG